MNETKKCLKCDKLKSVDNFRFNKKRQKFESPCKQCIKKWQNNYDTTHKKEKHQYYLAHQEEKKQNSKEYRNSNLAARKEYEKDYYKSHKQERLTKNKEYRNNRLKIDINFKITNNIRSRLNNAINKNQKIGSAIEDLGCSIEFLKQHLELKFYLNIENNHQMSWNNYGIEWEIDHIIPLSTLDLTNENEFYRAVHYTNLQPLWIKDNLEKGNSLTWDWE